MFITPNHSRSWSTASGEQRAFGNFLILMQSQDVITNTSDHLPRATYPDESKLFAIVRKVKLTQMGHWMMGEAFVANERIGLSGAYGGDGLPVHVPSNIARLGIYLPHELYLAWAKDDTGHNSAGSSGDPIRRWAQVNLATLRLPVSVDHGRPKNRGYRNVYTRRYRWYDGDDRILDQHTYCDVHVALTSTLTPIMGVPSPLDVCEMCGNKSNEQSIVTAEVNGYAKI
jgi:hypothetical protein